MHRDFILLRGAPGTGKSSVARHLAKYLPKGAAVEVDAIRGMVHEVSWDDDQLHCKAIAAAASVAKSYLASGQCPILFVDTLGFGRLETALKELSSKSVSIYSLVCRDPILSIRLWCRLGGYRAASSARHFNRHILADADRFDGVIDTTWTSPRSVARRILRSEGLAP